LGLWLGGAALGGLVLLRDLWAVRRLRRTARPVTNSAFSERVAHWAAPLGLRRPVRLAESEAVGVPVLAGLWHPVLLLPPGFAVRMEMAQEAVLVHELAHLRQGDLGTLALARLTGVLLWWHPLVWLTVARLWATAEEVCDDWAVALTATRQGYAEALVQLAEATTASAGSLACVRWCSGCGGSCPRPTRRWFAFRGGSGWPWRSVRRHCWWLRGCCA
jgi:beta-lactamase regulating signal transducer with metallopeptidase domain